MDKHVGAGLAGYPVEYPVEFRPEYELEFRQEGHVYTVSGEDVPSVSDLIAPFSDYDEDDAFLETAMETAAERGVICHAVVAAMLEGDEAEYPAAYGGYVEAMRRFFSEHAVVPVAVERPVYSPRMGLAGTPDLLCEFDAEGLPEEDALAILDYKLVAQVAKTRVKAQLNFYRRIYADNGVEVRRLYAVQFLPDGRYRLYPVKADDDEVDICLEVRRLKEKKHERGMIG